jgi:hypothetical protein
VLYLFSILGHNEDVKANRASIMAYRVSKTSDGRVLVVEDTGFAASFVDGKWVDKIAFDAYEMRDELKKVRDQNEAEKLWQEAHKAVSKVPA